MKKILLLIIGLYCSVGVWGQAAENQERIIFVPKIVGISETYLGLTISTSLPTNDFSGTQPHNTSGYAKPGYKVSLDGAFIFFRNAGLGWTFGRSVNALNTHTYQQELEYRLPQGGELKGVFTSDNWINTYLLIGPYMSLPEDDFMLDFGFYFGLSASRFPETQFWGTFRDAGMEHLERSDGAISFVTYGQISMSKYLKENFRLFVKGEMLFTRPTFNKIIDTRSSVYTLNTTQEEKQSLSFIGLGIGCAYEFQGRKKKKKL